MPIRLTHIREYHQANPAEVDATAADHMVASYHLLARESTSRVRASLDLVVGAVQIECIGAVHHVTVVGTGHAGMDALAGCTDRG